jgi:hypothetical protein
MHLIKCVPFPSATESPREDRQNSVEAVVEEGQASTS